MTLGTGNGSTIRLGENSIFMKITILIISLLMTLSMVVSCSKGGSAPPPLAINCDNVAKDFSNNVNPIIQTFCNQANCHNPGSANGPGQLTNYTEVFNARAAIRSAVQSGLMPQNTTLSTSQKNTIICWIDSGAPN